MGDSVVAIEPLEVIVCYFTVLNARGGDYEDGRGHIPEGKSKKPCVSAEDVARAEAGDDLSVIGWAWGRVSAIIVHILCRVV